MIKLLVGLGNPTAQYEHTRHNAGRDLVAQIADNYNQSFTNQSKLKAHIAKLHLQGHTILLAYPNVFMNLSGESVQALKQFYNLQNSEICVLHDELDLPNGHLKFKVGGGAGGHNGLKDIINKIGADFIRLRIGIDRPNHSAQVANFVLTRAVGKEREEMQDKYQFFINHILEALILEDFNKTIQKLHLENQ
jgi:PTH1 family peptidyl-tRNA hydrolase